MWEGLGPLAEAALVCNSSAEGSTGQPVEPQGGKDSWPETCLLSFIKYRPQITE